jgi:hypothetical protein
MDASPSDNMLYMFLQVISQALTEARLPAHEMTALEMHGTGTPLGDPIEVGAALAVLAGGKSGVQYRDTPLSLWAAKSSLGHTEPAAGAAGILHAVSRYVSRPLLSLCLSLSLALSLSLLSVCVCVWVFVCLSLWYAVCMPSQDMIYVGCLLDRMF